MIEESKWLESNRPDIRFEDTAVGRMKKDEGKTFWNYFKIIEFRSEPSKIKR